MQQLAIPGWLSPLCPAEAAICGRLQATLADGGDCVALSLEPAAPGSIIRGGFLSWFLREAIPATGKRIARLEIAGATMQGALALSGSRLTLRPAFAQCRFDSPIELTEATLPGFELLDHCVMPAIDADRAEIQGSLRVCSATVEHLVRLRGAHIHGDLDLQGSTLKGARPARGVGMAANANDLQHDPRLARLALAADGVTIDGHALLREHFQATAEVRLDGCHIGRNLDCSSAVLDNRNGLTLSAAGARILGTVYLGSPYNERHGGENPGFVSYGMVRLDGVRIEGDLDCCDGQFIASAFCDGWSPASGMPNHAYALRANGIDVRANVRMAAKFHAHGNVSLLNAHIGRDLTLSGGLFEFAGGEALCCDGVVVEGLADLRPFAGIDEPRFRSDGLLRFVLADLRQGLDASGASFSRADQGASILADEKFALFRPPELDGGGRGSRDLLACGILAEDAKIGGRFTWTEIVGPLPAAALSYPFWLHLGGATAELVDDDLQSWDCLDRVNVTNFRYGGLTGFSDEKARRWRVAGGDRYCQASIEQYVAERLNLLDREYAVKNSPGRFLGWSYVGPSRIAPPTRESRPRGQPLSRAQAYDRFKPQAYLQLARVLRAAGLDGPADRVVVRLEVNRTRYGGYRWPHALARCIFLDLLVDYGFSSIRPLIILLAWAMFSSVAFQTAYSAHRIEPTWHNRTDLTKPPDVENAHVVFNPVVFALDTLVPLVDLDQKDNWEVEPLTRHGAPDNTTKTGFGDGATYYALWHTFPCRPAALLVIFNKFFGWLLTTLFAGGVTGILRGGRELPEMPGTGGA